MPSNKPRLDKRFLAIALFFIIGLYVLLPQFGDFKSSRHLLSHPQIVPLLEAIASVAITYLAAAGTYYFLAYKKLKYWRTVLVELAAMFVNRLLPAGIGALGANYLYLKKSNNNNAQAGTIVAINNALGFIGHGLLSLIILLVYSGNMVHISGHESNSWTSSVKYIIGGLLILLALATIFGHRRINKFILGVGKQIASYSRKPWKLFAALGTSMILTLSNVLCLYFCMNAVGVSLSFFAVFLIFSFGVSAGTATPTPGGLGGYEAALMAGFIAYGVAGPAALAVALLYRFVSYWLALAVGSVAFFVSQKRGYI